MNVCQHCGAKQGEFYVYLEVNKRIQQMEKVGIYLIYLNLVN